MSIILLIFILSFSFSNEINNIPKNIESLSKMSGDSFVENIISDTRSHYYRIALVQYPGEIFSGHFSYGDKYKNYFIQTNFLNINYGKMSNEDGDSFNANEYMFDLSIVRDYSNNFMIGSSVGYSNSKIREYRNQNIIHSIGFRKSFSNNSIIVGLSLENMIHSIEEYSNISIRHTPLKKISFQLKPDYMNSELSMHYSSFNKHSSELIISVTKLIGNNINLLAGKSLHISNNSFESADAYFDNISMGTRVLSNLYIIDLGFQYLGDMGIIIGTSVSINIK
tara:strand:- start:7645 stop:8487 length:843 start_codon:yes stop_codon:yes gene_type:complete